MRLKKHQVLLRLGHPIMRQAMATLCRQLHDPTAHDPIFRWSVAALHRTGFEALLVFHYTVTAINELREPLHDEVMSPVFRVEGDRLVPVEDDFEQTVLRSEFLPIKSAGAPGRVGPHASGAGGSSIAAGLEAFLARPGSRPAGRAARPGRRRAEAGSEAAKESYRYRLKELQDRSREQELEQAGQGNSSGSRPRPTQPTLFEEFREEPKVRVQEIEEQMTVLRQDVERTRDLLTRERDQPAEGRPAQAVQDAGGPGAAPGPDVPRPGHRGGSADHEPGRYGPRLVVPPAAPGLLLSPVVMLERYPTAPGAAPLLGDGQAAGRLHPVRLHGRGRQGEAEIEQAAILAWVDALLEQYLGHAGAGWPGRTPSPRSSPPSSASAPAPRRSAPPGRLRRRQRHGARPAGHGRHLAQVGRGRGRTVYARFLELLRGTGHRLGPADQRPAVPAHLCGPGLRVVVRVGDRPLVRRRRGDRGTRRAAATAVARVARSRSRRASRGCSMPSRSPASGRPTCPACCGRTSARPSSSAEDSSSPSRTAAA